MHTTTTRARAHRPTRTHPTAFRILVLGLVFILSLVGCASTTTHTNPSSAPGSGSGSASSTSASVYRSYYPILSAAIATKTQIAYTAGYLHGSGSLSDTQYSAILKQGESVDKALHLAQDGITAYLQGFGGVTTDGSLPSKLLEANALFARLVQLAIDAGILK